MPCDSIRYLSVKLEVADWVLMDRALRALPGARNVTVDVKAQNAALDLDGEYIQIYGGKVRVREDVAQQVIAKINQGYTRQVVKAAQVRFGVELRQVSKNQVKLRLRS